MKPHFDSELFSPKLGYSAHSRENRLCLVTLSETDQYNNTLFSACNLNVYPFSQISGVIQAFQLENYTLQ